MKGQLISLVRKVNAKAHNFGLKAWSLVGRSFGLSDFSATTDFAIAILVHNPRGYQLDELTARFAGEPNVYFVGWGPFARSGGKGRWLISGAGSWRSAANFAMQNIRAKKLLVVGQQFDLTESMVSVFSGLPVGTCPVVLDVNGLIVSAGVDAAGKFVLGGFNVADLPTGFGSTSALPGEIVLAGAGFAWDNLRVSYDVRVRHLKTWAVPVGKSSEALLVSSKAQRWAIKNPAWANARGDNWGDTFFVNDLIAALRGLGHHVAEDRLQNWNRPSRKFDDVELVIRGKSAYVPSGKAKSILWVISHPELVTVEEVRSYDLVFAASASWAERMSAEAGKPVEVLYQATNPARFKVRPAVSALKSDVLFVGRTREVFREVVDFAIRAKAKLSVYGGGWAEFIDAKFIKGDFLPNEQVGAAYASCELLLNDHWQDMREQGFVSNRLFDAAACGTRVLSDHIDGLDALFGGLVQTYQDFDDFERLVADRSAWPSDAQRKKLAAAIARDHSFEARAKVLDGCVNP